MTAPVVAARFISVGEAEIAKSALEAAGIDCDLVDESIVGIDWTVAQAVGGVKLIVRREDLEAARDVLRAAPPEPEALLVASSPVEEPALDLEVKCPECASRDFQPIPRARMFLLFAAVFIGIGVAVGEPVIALTAFIAVAVAVMMLPSTRCRSCGHRWSPPPPERRVEAPGPDPRDTIEDQCPRCGSTELRMIDYRRLKAVPLLFNLAIFIAVPIWLMSPRRVCESCGHKF